MLAACNARSSPYHSQMAREWGWLICQGCPVTLQATTTSWRTAKRTSANVVAGPMSLLRYFSPRSGGSQQAQQSWEAASVRWWQPHACALAAASAQSDVSFHS
jgi:hypothetical protein